MTEILTESFCERCGTRYTFESAAPRRSPLSRVRVLSRGVRNFVLSDDASLSEAMAQARGEDQLAATTQQLDAFHKTFNFCMTCRQYTCGDCWNTIEGRCLTCAPNPDLEQPAALIDLAPAVEVAYPGTNGHDASAPADLQAWPDIDLPADRLARVLETGADEGHAAAAEPVASQSVAQPEPPGSPEPLVGAGEATEPLAAEPVAAEPAEAITPEAAAPMEALDRQVAGVAPGQSIDEAIAAYEALLAAEEAGIAPAAAEPVKPALERGVMAEAEPAAAQSMGEPAPIAAEPASVPEPAPIAAEPAAAEAAPAVAPVPPLADQVQQPTWPGPAVPSPAPKAPATPPPAPSPWLTVAPEDAPPPQWPSAPQWPFAAARTEARITLAGRPLLAQADASALWAASAQEVLGAAPAPLAASVATATAQPCVACGLSLSANARFCRRCGSRQS